MRFRQDEEGLENPDNFQHAKDKGFGRLRKGHGHGRRLQYPGLGLAGVGWGGEDESRTVAAQGRSCIYPVCAKGAAREIPGVCDGHWPLGWERRKEMKRARF